MDLEAKNLVKEYERRGQKFRAVNDVSLSIPKGKITAIMGRSGSGKSTLLNILAGMIKADEGEVLLDGQSFSRMSRRELERLRASKIGIIPQSQSLIGGLTVADNIRLRMDLASPSGKSEKELPKDIIMCLGLEDLLNVYPHKLSGGEMKRVAIARALVGNSEYILADEPTGELDAENMEKVMGIFRKKAESGKTVLLITHDPAAGEKADTVYRMENGVISV